MPLPPTPPPPRRPSRPISRVSGRAPPPPWARGEGEGLEALATPLSGPAPTLESFEIVRSLGRGSRGEVLEVRRLSDGSRFALKRSLRPLSGPAQRRHWLRECHAQLGAGPAPGLLPLQAAWEQRGHFYLLTPLCPHGSLGHLWRRGGGAWRRRGVAWLLEGVASFLRGVVSSLRGVAALLGGVAWGWRRETGVAWTPVGVAKPDLGVAKSKVGVAKPTSGAATPKLGVAKTQWGVAKPELGVAKPKTGVAKPELGVAKPKTGVAKPELGVADSWGVSEPCPSLSIITPSLSIISEPSPPPSITTEPLSIISEPSPHLSIISGPSPPLSEPSPPLSITSEPLSITSPPQSIISEPPPDLSITSAPLSITSEPLSITSVPLSITSVPLSITSPPPSITSAPLSITSGPSPPLSITPSAPPTPPAPVCGRPVAEWRLRAYLWDVLLTLRHLHALPLAHGDLKPDNVLLDGGGRCRLADFGLSSAPGAGPWRGGGDPRYLAPEGLRGEEEEGQGGPPGDIFSLALAAAELAGERALPGAGEGWRRLRRGGGAELPAGLGEGLSPELRALLAAMLEPDPRLRPSAAELLTWRVLRGAGRWRPLTRLADVALRKLDDWLEALPALGSALWARFWRHFRGPRTPPRPPRADPWRLREEEEEEEGAPPRRGEGSRSPSPTPDPRRTLTFDDDDDPEPLPPPPQAPPTSQ